MPIKDALLPEFDQEMANTRRTLERVPDDRFSWKPHAKSGTMGWLAGHLAMIPYWALITLQQDSFDVAPKDAPAHTPPKPETRADLLKLFDKNVAEARAALDATGDAAFLQMWTLLSAGQKMFTLPRGAVLRSMVMNHLIHHRAQLGVYLRLTDVPVPAIYGPSADEPPQR